MIKFRIPGQSAGDRFTRQHKGHSVYTIHFSCGFHHCSSPNLLSVPSVFSLPPTGCMLSSAMGKQPGCPSACFTPPGSSGSTHESSLALRVCLFSLACHISSNCTGHIGQQAKRTEIPLLSQPLHRKSHSHQEMMGPWT